MGSNRSKVLSIVPPGSFWVDNDLQRIVISVVIMDPGATVFVPRPIIVF